MSITEISMDSVSAMTPEERKSLYEFLSIQVENDEYQQSQPLQNQNEIRKKVLELGQLVLGISDDDPDDSEYEIE
jgi:hypothetical protein